MLLRSVGVLPVVVHGGGPQIGELTERLGKEPEFRDGLRVTDAGTLEIARDGARRQGRTARSSLRSTSTEGSPSAFRARTPISSGGATRHRTRIRRRRGGARHCDRDRLLGDGLIPVVATIGADSSGQAYNINADSVAGALAAALEAEKLVFLTDVEGLRTDRPTRRRLATG